MINLMRWQLISPAIQNTLSGADDRFKMAAPILVRAYDVYGIID